MLMLQKYESTGYIMLTKIVFFFHFFFFYQKQLVMISIASVFLWQVQMSYGIFGFPFK